jgi:hypothetical protein
MKTKPNFQNIFLKMFLLTFLIFTTNTLLAANPDSLNHKKHRRDKREDIRDKKEDKKDLKEDRKDKRLF